MDGQSDFIFELENALSREQCEALIARFESDPRKGPGKIAKGYDPSVKRTTDLVLPLDGPLLESLRPVLKIYHRLYPTLPREVEAIACMVMKYDPGGFYNWHNDAASLTTMARQYVAIWYLNDVQGGQTQFMYYPGRQITPTQGKLALFPAGWTHAHRAAVALTTKYIATAWLSLKGSYERQIGRNPTVSDDGLQGPSAPVCGAPEEGGRQIPHPDCQGT